MIEPITVPEKMMYCTTRLVGLDASDAPFKFGTGFFYEIPIPADAKHASSYH